MTSPIPLTSPLPRFFAILLACLSPAIAAASALGQSSYAEQEAEEVERVKSMLRSYYAEEKTRANEAEQGAQETDSSLVLAGESYEFAAIALSGTEGISALEHIAQRLVNDAIPAVRRETNIIFNIEVRRSGKLVSSKAYSLKALGKSQYIAKVSMLAGDALFIVRKNEWAESIPGPQDQNTSADYLVTLNAPPDRAPELHIISVIDLKATNWTQIPPWLPYIGALPSQS